MKKVLALVLAVMMLATVAFAADITATNPDTGDMSKVTTVAIPGSTIDFNDSGLIAQGADASKLLPINSDNYKAKVKWENNGKLVASTGFNDTDDTYEIKLKQDYTMTSIKKLEGTVTLTSKKKDANGDKYPTIVVTIDKEVGYVLADGKVNVPSIEIDKNNDAAFVASPDGSFTNKDFHAKVNEKFLWKVVDNGAKYGTLEFDTADDDTEVEVRVYDGNKLYLYNTTKANTSVLKAQADADADITFLNFPGTPGFDSTATVRFYKDEESYIYGLKDGQLTNVNAKWDDDEGCFILKTRTLGSYVFSDKKLNVSASTAADNNPDTGANDVVGIATALAAVALVSAAAVSLKK